MNYVYDILVNFSYPIIEFYDWNKDDNILNIKRIPFYKIKSNVLEELKNSKFKIDVTKIKGLTKIFNNKKNYNSVVYTDGDEAIAFKFDDKGICIGKSKLLIEEEKEILDSAYMVEITDIEYEIISSDNIDVYKTRNQSLITEYLANHIDKIDDLDKLTYINYECFGEYRLLDKNELICHIRSEWNDKYYEIYNFLTNYSMNKM